MKSLPIKKVVIVFAVILVITVGMIVLGLSFGNTSIPGVDNPNEIIYQQVDENGDVLYTITKQELYEQMKTNNGVNQLLSIIDESFLADYIADVTQAEIDKKIEYLTYGTNDQDIIASYDAEEVDNLLINFERSMVLSGYHDGQEETYARLVVAREKFVLDRILETEVITENDVAEYYISSYFDDIQALRLRFLSKGDGVNVLRHFNLAEVDDALTVYLGYIFLDEDLVYTVDDVDIIVEAYETEDAYYYDSNENILDIHGDTAYTYVTVGQYVDDDDVAYTIDANGNILDDESNLVLDNALIFDNQADAKAYQEAHTTYYTLEEVNDVIEVRDLDGVLTYKIDGDIIYDSIDNDVTNAVDLRVNKEFTAIEDVEDFTENNTSSLTDEEVLSYFIQMYNYIYGEYRDTLDENSTVQDLIDLDSEYFSFNFDTVNEQDSSLATLMFDTVSALNDTVYSASPVTSGDYAYMVYKLDEGVKVDIEKIVMDLIKESIIVPEVATSNITLITEGIYDSKITWSSSDPDIISNAGVVVLPEENTIVSLSYTIEVLGVEETGVKVIQVPTSGENSEIGTFDDSSLVTLKAILDDDTLYDELVLMIADEMVYGSQSSSTITSNMTDARTEANLSFYDYFLALDYKTDIDSTYEYTGRGSNTNIASIEIDGSTVYITAETFYQKNMSRNPSLMIFYASQYKEAIYSDHYVTLFGTNRDILDNKTQNMQYLNNYVASIQNEYNSFLSNPTYLNLYEQYYGWSFDSFQTYLYTRYRVESIESLLQNLVLSELRMLFIQQALDNESIEDIIYANVEDNYDNFFSLDAQQILLFFDFNEDGELDDYNEYYASLDQADKDEFDALVSQLETLISESESTFSDIVEDYEGISRDDEVWGAFKKAGFILVYESLNAVDDNEDEHSVTYSGEYGVKDSYVEEFTTALHDLYLEYQNPLNVDLDSIISDAVPTVFGLHFIEVEKGDDFTGVSLMIEDGDYSNISSVMLNDSNMPTLDQVSAYYIYKLYDQYNDIENASMIDKYGVTLPIIPSQVVTDLDFYAADVLDTLFTSNMVNYAFILRIADGEVVNGLTQANFDENMQLLIDIYYEVTIGDIVVE